MLNDLRYAVRSLLKSPAFTIAAVLCLALAIGANTAIFSVIDSVLLRPLPFAQPERLVALWERNVKLSADRNSIAPANYLDWKARTRVFEQSAVYYKYRLALTGLGDPVEVPVEVTTASFLPLLGVAPELGRGFTEAEDRPGAESVVVLSYGFWRRHFNGDRGVLGRVIMLGGAPATVIGVMPAGFGLPGSDAELWTPLGLDPALDYRIRAGRYLKGLARLAPGVTAAEADAQLQALARQLEEEYPRFNGGWSAAVVPLTEQVVGAARRTIFVLAGVVAFVLLIACANVANLQLARAAGRRREIAVRAALGASRARVVRDLLTESVLLAMVGGGLGLLLALWGTEALVAAAPAGLPRADEIGISGRALLFTCVLSLATGVLFGLMPALQASRADLHETLKEGSRGTTANRARGLLVAAQLALSLVLLVGAGLMLRSFAELSRVSPGFTAEHLLTARVSLPDARYDTDPKQGALFASLLERARGLPGVRSASVINFLPFGGLGSATNYFIAGRPLPRPNDEPVATISAVDPDFFRTMEIPVLQGEPFTERDGPTAPKKVAISRRLADEQFPGMDPIGQRILMPWRDTLVAEIVAVVGDVHSAGLDSMPRPTLYWNFAQFPWSGATVVVRTSGDPLSVAEPLRRELQAIDPELPLGRVKPMEAYLGDSVATRRFTMLLIGAFAAVAVILAAIGIAGVMTNGVAQRTREIGVRLALGARPADVLRMVLRQGMTMVAAGIVAGVLGALALTRVLQGLLYGTSPTDPLTFAGVAALLAVIALVATYLPARRATRVDPLEALRSE
jgi:putative ABC transport system permease protein